VIKSRIFVLELSSWRAAGLHPGSPLSYFLFALVMNELNKHV